MDYLLTRGGHPPALWVLVSLKMWESFSYYGMQALLVLYLTKQLGYEDYRALGVYAIYQCLIELASVYGGVLGDRIGLLKAVAIGSTLIVLGHIGLSLPLLPIYLGLAFIVLGTGLFRPNTTALLGSLYDESTSHMLDSAYTLFYSSLNLGGFLAGILCGTIGEKFGWHYGFSLAALGMGIGWVIFHRYKRLLPTRARQNMAVPQNHIYGLLLALVGVIALLYYQEYSFYGVPLLLSGCVYFVIQKLKDSTLEERCSMGMIGLFTVFIALFFALEEQISSTLVLFASRHVDRGLWGIEIPASSLVAINPFVIIIGGGILVSTFKKSTETLSRAFLKVIIAFGIQVAAFAALYLSCDSSVSFVDVPLAFMGIALGLIGASELFIGPTVWAVCSAIGPKRFQGTLMGLVMMGYASGNLLAGFLSRLMVVEGLETGELILEQSLRIYQAGFMNICLIGVGCMIFVGMAWFMVNRFDFAMAGR